MEKIITKEDEVEIEEVIKDKMEEENLEDRTEVPAINPEDNLKDTTDLSPTVENLALNQNKTTKVKANQKKE